MVAAVLLLILVSISASSAFSANITTGEVHLIGKTEYDSRFKALYKHGRRDLLPPSTEYFCPNGGAQQPLAMIDYFADEQCKHLYYTWTYYGCVDPTDIGYCSLTHINMKGLVLGSVKLKHSWSDQAVISITRNYNDPCGDDARAVVASLVAGSSGCVTVPGLKGTEGFYYNVDGIPRTSGSSKGKKLKCKTFNKNGEKVVYTTSQRVSSIVNCRNSATACTISSSVQKTQSITTTVSVDGGFDVGFFKTSASVGHDYTDSVTTTIQSSFSVPAGQAGYLTAYARATWFNGTFSDCNHNVDPKAEIVAVQSHGLIYAMVLTDE